MNAVRETNDRDQALMTADGYELLRSELELLSTQRRTEMSERLREARQDGHLANNPALYDALEEQARLEHRISMLEKKLAAAEIAFSTADGSAGIGSFVRVRELHSDNVAEYELVGPMEPGVGNGRVSVEAPVGRALVGQATGGVAQVEIPGGTVALEILAVRGPDNFERTRQAA